MSAAQHDAPFKVLSMLDIDNIPVTDDNMHVIAEARGRLRECQALVSLAAGREFPLPAHLMPLMRAIDDTIKGLEVLNREPFDEIEGDALVDMLMHKEDCQAALDLARVAGVVLVTHLSAALDAINRVAVQSTNG